MLGLVTRVDWIYTGPGAGGGGREGGICGTYVAKR